MKRTRRILFATDFSPASRPAFRSALDLARSLKADLVLTHALAPIGPLDGVYAPYVDWTPLEEATREAAQKSLERLAAATRKRGVRATTVLTSGSAAAEIVQTARARRVNLIVMGTHGRTGLTRLVMGSVALRVMMTAPCPVMTLRGK